MTGDAFTEVDIDLLADYVGGVLDGTPDETVVAALLTDDPAWRDAYELLTGGVAAVRADLRQLGAAAEPMPAELSARLDAAFAALPPLTGAEPDESEPRRHLHAVPAAGGPGSGRERSTRTASRQRLRRWAAPIAVAAGVLAFAGIGVGELLTSTQSEEAASTAAGQPYLPLDASDAARSAEDAAGSQRFTATGTDYRRDTLSQLPFGLGVGDASAEVTRRSQVKAAEGHVAPSQRAPAPSTREPNAAYQGLAGPQRARDSAAPDGELRSATGIPPALLRLNARAALLKCLDAIATEHRGGTITARSVDFASFEGSPAVVVRFTAADDHHAWVWASGPDCGTPGAGADTRYHVRVG